MADAAELSALLDRIDALKKENASLEAEIAGGSAVVMYDLACANESVRFSPYCWRVKMALAHKGVNCDFKAWHFTQKDVLKPSGQGAVPVLVHQGEWIHDSWDIAVFLDAKYPNAPRLIPENESACLFAKYFTEKCLHGPLFRLVLIDIISSLTPEDQKYFVDVKVSSDLDPYNF